jgi:hypothetical protein
VTYEPAIETPAADGMSVFEPVVVNAMDVRQDLADCDGEARGLI